MSLPLLTAFGVRVDFGLAQARGGLVRLSNLYLHLPSSTIHPPKHALTLYTRYGRTAGT